MPIVVYVYAHSVMFLYVLVDKLIELSVQGVRGNALYKYSLWLRQGFVPNAGSAWLALCEKRITAHRFDALIAIIIFPHLASSPWVALASIEDSEDNIHQVYVSDKLALQSWKNLKIGLSFSWTLLYSGQFMSTTMTINPVSICTWFWSNTTHVGQT